jgi:hypothetical protein
MEPNVQVSENKKQNASSVNGCYDRNLGSFTHISWGEKWQSQILKNLYKEIGIFRQKYLQNLAATPGHLLSID